MMIVLLSNLVIRVCYTSYAGPNVLHRLLRVSYVPKKAAFTFELLQNYINQWYKLFPELRKYTNKRLLDISDIELVENVLILNKYDDLIVIWCDNHLEEEIRNMLYSLHNHIKYCSTIEQLKDRFSKIEEHYKIILITSGQYSRYTLDLFHEHEQIDSIFIYCTNEQYYEDLITKGQYKKLIGIFTHYVHLFNLLEKQMRLISKQLSVFKLFDRNNRSIRDLENQSIEYLWYQLLRDTLMKMERDLSKQEMLDYCRLYYQSDPILLKAIDHFEQTYSPKEAIQWYTKNSFPFYFINKALRTEDVHALYKLRYFIIDLCKNIKLVHDENLTLYQEIFEPLMVYRGLTLSDRDIHELQSFQGKYVSTNGFLSTSRSRQVADTFASNVIFEIEINPNIKTNIYAYIAYISLIPDEEEVLFDLGALFQITDIKYEHDKWLVSMIGIPDKDFLNNTYVEKQRDAVSSSNTRPLLVYGVYLVEMGYFDKSIEYFEELLKNPTTISTLSRYEQYLVFHYLSNAYNQNKQPNIALKYATHVLEQTMNAIRNLPEYQPHPLYSVDRCLQSVGIAYANMNEYDLALECFERAFLITSSNIKSLISLHQLVGHTYYRQRKYFYALKHCKKALKLIHKYHPTDLFNEAEVYETLADIYEDLKLFVSAIEYLEKAAALRKTMFPHNHSDHGVIHIKLGSIYYTAKKVDKALKHLQNALEIFGKSTFNGIFEIIEILRASFATLYMYKKDYNSAEEYYKKSLEFDENKGATVHAYEGLALCYMRQRKIDLAIKYATYALETQAEITLVNEVRTASLHFSLGHCFQVNNQYELAMKHYQISLELFKSNFNQNLSSQLARLYQHIANNYISMGMKNLALERYKQALELREKMIPLNDSTLFVLHYKIARYYTETCEYILAVQHYEKALEISKRMSILDAVVQLYVVLATLYGEAFGNYKLAIETQKKAVETQRKIEPFNLTEIDDLLSKVDVLYEQKHQYCHKLMKISCRDLDKHSSKENESD